MFFKLFLSCTLLFNITTHTMQQATIQNPETKNPLKLVVPIIKKQAENQTPNITSTQINYPKNYVQFPGGPTVSSPKTPQSARSSSPYWENFPGTGYKTKEL